MTAAMELSHSFAGYAADTQPRLVVPAAIAAPLELAAERELGTYDAPRCADVIGELAAANLRGRGGAAFPAHVKWQAVARAPGPKVVVANGEEGEPSSRKDRWLLTNRPHLVLDGLLLAATTVGAEQAVVYLSHPDTVSAVQRAITELYVSGLAPSVPRLEVHTVAPTYVAGEETAVCRSIGCGPALPQAKPPRPFEAGVHGLPTLVSNVETLAYAAWIARNGAASYREYGTDSSPGTFLVTLGGACWRPGVYEVPYGMSVAGLFRSVAGGFTSSPQAFVMGGWFGGVLGAHRADVRCCYDFVRDSGSGLGCAAITALGVDDDPLAVAADIAAWYADESAQQCGVCIKGTSAIRDTLRTLKEGRASGTDRDKLVRWGQSLPHRGACAFLDGAAAWARTVVDELPEHVVGRIASAGAADQTTRSAEENTDEGQR